MTGSSEGLQHRCCYVIRVFSLSRQDVEGNDVVCASWVNVDQSVAVIEVIQDPSGDQQPEQVIYQEGMGVDQAAASPGGNILIEAMLQELGLASTRHTNDIHVGGAG